MPGPGRVPLLGPGAVLGLVYFFCTPYSTLSHSRFWVCVLHDACIVSIH